MRHQKAGRKLGRTSSHRKAMFRNMLASFFEWGKIETTTIKAKELRPLAEKMISLGKRGDLHARRKALQLIPNKKIVHKLFNEIAPEFNSRLGGYTRIIRAGYRAGDKAPMSIIEIISEEIETKKKKGGKRKKRRAKAVPEAKKEVVEARPSEKEKEAEENSLDKGAGVEKTVAEGMEGDPKDLGETSSVSEEMKGTEKKSGEGEGLESEGEPQESPEGEK
ncbi:MAG: 50S ribosomal protein L17 [Deltaproteobacteria bacterium]|nr:50S ribosomal protein L17 [Deltaproteobacteria bacterium]